MTLASSGRQTGFASSSSISDKGSAGLLGLLPRLFIVSLMVPIYIYAGPIILMPHRIFLLLCFIPLLLLLFIRAKELRLGWVDALFIFATGWAALAILVSAPAGLPIESIGLYVIEFLGAYLVARVGIRSSADFKKLVIFGFWALFLIVPFAVVEAVTHKPVLLNLIPNSYPPVYAPERMGMRRAQALFSHPILFGVFSSTFVGLFLYILPKVRGFFGTVIAFFGAAVSLSTGALISVVCQSVFIGWDVVFRFLKNRWKIFSILCAVGYVALDLASNRTPFHILVSYASFNSGSAYNRILIWRYGTQNVADNPMFGLGLNVENWARPDFMGASTDNFWLLMAMSYGLPMIMAFGGAVALVIWKLSRAPLTSEQDRKSRAGYLVAMGGLIIAGGTVHYWHAMMAFALFMFGAGLWAVTGGAQEEHAEADSSSAQDASTRKSRYSRFAPSQEAHGVQRGVQRARKS